MPTALTTACLAAALLSAGSTAAQQTPDLAGAQSAVAALVAAWQANDWDTVARFVGSETAAAVAHSARVEFAEIGGEAGGEGITADSLRALADAVSRTGARLGGTPGGRPLEDEERQIIAHLYRWTASLLDGGQPTDTAVMARVLDLVYRCDEERTLHLPPVQYEPVGATAVAGGGEPVVEVVGRFYRVGPDGQPDRRDSVSAITPVEWDAGRWTVAERQSRGAKAGETNPVARFLTWDLTQWGYAIAHALSNDARQDAPGCSGVSE